MNEVEGMLQLTIHPPEMWDEKNEKFVYGKAHTISLEHSLVSVKKWESKWCKPFLSKEAKTTEGGFKDVSFSHFW